MAQFYSPQGLKEIAVYLDDLIDKQQRYTQQAIADCAGVSSSTIASLRMHRHNREEIVSRKPDPDLLIKLTWCIPDPQTDKPFQDEWRLIRVANGFEPLFLKRIDAKTDPVDQPGQDKLPYPAAVETIRKGMGKRSLKSFAARVEIEPERLEEILTTSDPSKALPKFDELLRLAGEVIPTHEAEPLAALYGFGRVNNGNGTGKLKAVQS